jgi:hypothetical protein
LGNSTSYYPSFYQATRIRQETQHHIILLFNFIKVLEFAKKDFKRKLKVLKTPFAPKSKADYRLLAESEAAKHTLSASASALLHVEMLCNDEDYDGKLTSDIAFYST